MKKTYHPTIFAWGIFLVSEVFAALIIFNLVSFKYLESGEENQRKTTRVNQIWIMGVTMIVGNGHGMAVFRLLSRVKTLIVKYIHVLIHTLILAGFIYGYYVMRTLMNENDQPHYSFEHLHTYLALLTTIVYFIQWLSGVFVYLYLYSNQRRRKLFAAWHNFIGICILQFWITTACIQLQELNYGSYDFGYIVRGYLYEYDLLFYRTIEQFNAENATIFMVIYGVLVNAIVLNPYLEWRLVGPL